MTKSPEFACHGLVAGFAGVGITPKIELVAHAGEILAVVGRNGAGKTTLLRTWLGQLKPVQGEVHLDGESVHATDARRRACAMAYVPQREPDGLDLTAYEFVATGRYAHSRGLWEDDRDQAAIQEALNWADVGDPKKLLSTFSGGERQRLTLARALAQQTPIVMMDEPGTHLDPAQSRKLGQSVVEMAQQGKTVFVVTHDVHWAQRYATHALLISQDARQGAAAEVLTEASLTEAFG